ncbi:uncharacterized protein EI90DRAFT_3040212 [Cantharellus anzutake]|uniref:uncharacterized protein n=1 Tax=Cantharellus anzutake TaxID=1750568 RepID=UPI001906D4C2|nr:uncharacterized protein EI90DRAFT_3040212 [Cantharellus anzutake]KAF8339076.1 hypothetical protein EI90DRAFT_3040212 [Cantharellus anzutake]
MMEDIRQRIQDMMLHGRDGELEDTERPSSPMPRPIPSSAGNTLSPEAKPFTPTLKPPHLLVSASSRQPSPLHSLGTPSPYSEGNLAPATVEEPEDGEDVEMGEVSEMVKDSRTNGHEKNKRDKRKSEELEEGEASDNSSELSSAPD